MKRNSKFKYITAVLLTLSGLIFSFGIPQIENKINEIKEAEEIFQYNALLAQFDRILGRISVNSLRTVQLLENSKTFKDTGTLEKIQEIYKYQIDESAQDFYFLEMAASESRGLEDSILKAGQILNRYKENPTELEKNRHAYNKKVYEELNSKEHYWRNVEYYAYGAAILFQLLGIYFGFFVREEPSNELLTEIRGIRGQLDRLTHSFKKKTENS